MGCHGGGAMARRPGIRARGQAEPLTARLQNVLKDYPANVAVLKELLQNADIKLIGRLLICVQIL